MSPQIRRHSIQVRPKCCSLPEATPASLSSICLGLVITRQAYCIAVELSCAPSHCLTITVAPCPDEEFAHHEIGVDGPCGWPYRHHAITLTLYQLLTHSYFPILQGEVRDTLLEDDHLLGDMNRSTREGKMNISCSKPESLE